jgi:hypothetical protein
MGLVLSILYFVTNYLTPATLFGPLAAIHIEIVLGVLIVFVSLHKLRGSIILKTPQSLALIGLVVAVFFSVLFWLRWPGRAVQTSLGFLPQGGIAYFLVVLHCNSKKKLQILVLMLLFVCLFVIANGCIALRGAPNVPSFNTNSHGIGDLPQEPQEIPYLYPTRNDAGEAFYRIRGLGQINDPNDLAQLIVSVIPLAFIFWQPKKVFRNIVLVLLPVCVLLFGAYLTHSRGALLALVVVAIVAFRQRIGTVPSLLIATGLFAAAMALHFTGGREISVDSGMSRSDLWAEGMGAFKTHPLFGVGAGAIGDYTEDGLTAHNSLVVCAAELGFFGLYFWSLFLFSTIRDALDVASPDKVSEGEPIVHEDGPFPQAVRRVEALDKEEVNRLARVLILSLTGFLITCWFLSRAFAITLFILGGMVEVVYEMALQRGMIGPRLRLARVLPYTGILAISLLLAMYILLRTMNLMR